MALLIKVSIKHHQNIHKNRKGLDLNQLDTVNILIWVTALFLHARHILTNAYANSVYVADIYVNLLLRLLH